jgi:hypothetical protein
MSTISLRLPESLHKRVKELARQEEISINQLITTAVAEKMAAMLTESYLAERASHGRRSRYDRVLRKVRAAPPADNDRID